MQYPALTPARPYDPGMGEAVANRTINRKITRPTYRSQKIEIPRRDDMALDAEVAAWCKSNNVKIAEIDGYHVDTGDGDKVGITLSVVGEVVIEDWADVCHRVAAGNSMLRPDDQVEEFVAMNHHLRQGSILMSGRHLQHGDSEQPNRNIEVFSNCSTSALSCLEFYLLLNGSGVGRCYDDAMMQVDWRLMPTVVCVIDGMHKDVQSGEIKALDLRSAKHLYHGKKVTVYNVPDTREGWGQAIEVLEVMSFQGYHRNDVLIMEFSGVRCKGSPIGGMQDRPASGPGPMMNAINNVANLRDAGMEPWRSTMYADHYFAECVLVGGARRAARMATKTWRDKNIFGFIELKRGGFLYTSNNSITVDKLFWEYVKDAYYDTAPKDLGFDEVFLRQHAWDVFNAVTKAAYYDKTGEPGFITVEYLTWNPEGIDILLDGDFAESAKYKLLPDTKQLTRSLAQAWSKQRYKVITNPCGEIVLAAIGAYCVIADVVPYHAGATGLVSETTSLLQWDADAEDAFKVTTRALIRTNLMDSMYSKEVKRTNRIGVGMTGIHEYAWSRFAFGWKDIVDEQKSMPFWLILARFKRAVQREAAAYATLLGVAIPHTDTTMKPAGTTSKLFGLTEGAHLPSMREFLRWVQFANNDPLIEVYRSKGYPIVQLKTYAGMTIVGFPTKPTICNLGMGDKLVTAAEATPEEQYEFLRLLEKYWIIGVEEDGVTPLRDTGNQVSYTLKYNPNVVDYEAFRKTLLDGQSTIRCCSVMPQEDTSAYEYLPEQPVTKAEFEMIAAAIESSGVQEDVGMEHVQCAGGACPISFGANVSVQ